MCALEYVSPPDCVCDGAWVQGRVYGVGCKGCKWYGAGLYRVWSSNQIVFSARRVE